MKQLLTQAKQTSYKFAITNIQTRKQILKDLSDLLKSNTPTILEANSKDLSKMEKTDSLYDRLLLTEERIAEIADACLEISNQEDVLNQTLEERTLTSGLNLKKISVAMGVIACIYEARPNVTVDIAALCIFTGNTSVLRGSSSAEHSNKALIQVIHQALTKNNIPTEVVSQYSINRDDLQILFSATEEVDLLIPRGGKGLIDRVRKESIVPVIETGAGVCHTYVDQTADIDMAVKIVVNAKTHRPSVCNALDVLLVQEQVSDEFYGKLTTELEKHQVIIHADETSHPKFQNYKHLEKSTNETWGKEFLSLQMGIKTVKNVEEAIDHINTHGSRHSDAIITENQNDVQKFFQLVDASSLYHNTSTRFTDGGVFGLGAEIGISTQKLHARGPMGAQTLTSYKYIIEGHGETR